ncbi:MAG TPA: outer membrane beta-barrel protein [Segetibacter sp.]|jgi:hypothetical protein
MTATAIELIRNSSLKTIMRTLMAVTSLISFCYTTSAQPNYIITAKVIDGANEKPLAGVTVSIFFERTTTAVTEGITNEAGLFRLQVRDTGNYKIELTYLKAKTTQNILVDKEEIDLGVIKLASQSATLKDVTVKATKKLIEQTDDKIIYNVENDPLARGEMAIDILRRTPSVSVDGNDNVRLNGQTNFRVLLNGRETAMFTQNVSDALRGFPGSTIVKIEVITNPSARYDAEGIGGIINIVTKKKIEGYNGSVSTWSTTINQHNFNANFNAKFNKIGVAIIYGNRSNINIPGFYTSYTIPTTNAFYSSRLLDGSRRASYFNQFGNGEVSWAVDSMSTLSFYGNVSGGSSKQSLDLRTITTLNNSPTTLVSDFDQASRRQFPTNTIGTDFIKKYTGKPDKEFSVRVNAELGKNDAFLESAETTSSYARFLINNSNANNKQYTIQSDYIEPLAPGVKLEVGARATLRRASSDFESSIKYNNAEAYKLNPANTDNFNFIQDIYSGYASYSFKIKSYNIRTGLRVEHTSINGSFQSAKTFAKNSYVNVLPNFQVSRRIKDLNLVLSYNQRLQRPSIAHLNPFVENNDSLNISFGNPDLDAQTIHTVQLQSRLLRGKTTMGLTFSSSYSNNYIVTLTTFNPTNGLRSNTYQNVGRDFLFNVNGNINTKFGEKWTYNANINFQFRALKNKFNEDQKNSGIGGNTNTGVTYIFNPRLRTTTYVGFEQTVPDLQSKPNTIPYCGTGVTYQLVQNKFIIGLMAQNYFAKYYDYTTVITGSTFKTTNTNKSLMGKMVLTLNWNFGKLKEQVSKKKGVTVDDAL